MTDSEGTRIEYLNKDVQLDSTSVLYVHVQLLDDYGYQASMMTRYDI